MLADAARIGVADRIDFLRAGLPSITRTRTRAVVQEIAARHDRIGALVLFANRQEPKRTTTAEGLEHTFTLY